MKRSTLDVIHEALMFYREQLEADADIDERLDEVEAAIFEVESELDTMGDAL